MKKSILFIIVLFAWISNIHAATIGHVVKIQNGLILIKFSAPAGKAGDIITIKRETEDGLIIVGRARVIRIAKNYVGAKIVTQQSGVSLKLGDVITDGNDSMALSSPSSFDYQMTDSNFALEKLLFVSNPVPVQNSEVLYDDSTALEKIWLNSRKD